MTKHVPFPIFSNSSVINVDIQDKPKIMYSTAYLYERVLLILSKAPLYKYVIPERLKISDDTQLTEDQVRELIIKIVVDFIHSEMPEHEHFEELLTKALNVDVEFITAIDPVTRKKYVTHYILNKIECDENKFIVTLALK